MAAATPSMTGGDTAASWLPQPGLLVNRSHQVRVTTSAQATSGLPIAAVYTMTGGFARTNFK